MTCLSLLFTEYWAVSWSLDS